MSRGVDNVDPIGQPREHFLQACFGLLGPKASNSRRCNGNPAFAFLLHPIRDRVTIIHVADLVNQARVEEYPLGRRGLAGINVRGNPDVAGAFERIGPPGCIRLFSAVHYRLFLKD